MEDAVAGPRHQCPAVEVHAADGLGRPVRVSAEQGVVVGRAQKADDAQLLHELVDQFLRAGFVQRALAESRSM